MRFAIRATMAGMILGCVAAVPAGAQASDAKKAKDPNEVVCEKQKELGSRVATKRICMTRAQWAERRLTDRQEVEKAQINRGMRGE